MARVGISITKSISYRGGTQEFSNVYYYQTNLASLPSQSEAAAIIDDLVALEKTWHSSNVTFVRGRLWSQEGSPAANNMIDQHNLSGVGARSTVANMDRERAFLFRIRAGNDSRGNPVYLRKWFHSCGAFVTTVTVTSAILEQTQGFTSTDRTNLVNQMHNIRHFVSNAITWNLCSKGGRDFGSGEDFVAHQYLEHRQLGDMWRAQ